MDRKYKFVFAISYRRGGGAERALSLLAGTLAQMGHEVTVVQRVVTEEDYDLDEKVKHVVVDRRPGIDFPEQPRLRFLPKHVGHVVKRVYWKVMASGIRLHGENLYLTFKWRSDIMKAIRDEEADFVIPMLEEMSFLGFAATRFSPSACIETIRCNPAIHPEGKVRRTMRNLYCLLAEGVFVQNASEGEYFPGFMQKRIFIVPNITDEAFRSITTPPKDKIRKFINAGRLVPQKNQKMLIRAFTNVMKETGNTEATLKIYGAGDLEKELRELVRTLGMEQQIEVPGRTTDLQSKYRESDAFLFASNFEGQPNALMEAMFAGLPCVSTDCPDGPADLIDNGENGILIPVGDQKKMEEAIRFFLEHPEEANEMGRKGKAFMEEHFRPEAIAQQLADECVNVTTKTR